MGSLVGAVCIEGATEVRGLVGHDADGQAVDAGEPGDHVVRDLGSDFVEGSVVEDPQNDCRACRSRRCRHPA